MSNDEQLLAVFFYMFGLGGKPIGLFGYGFFVEYIANKTH